MLSTACRTQTGAACSTSGRCSLSTHSALLLPLAQQRKSRYLPVHCRQLCTRLAAADAAFGATRDEAIESFEVAPQAAPGTAAAQRQLWMAAIKLPMYSVGFIPVLVGAAAAFYQSGIVPWGQVGRLVLGAISIIAWLNLSNDGFDAQTGVDKSKPESLVNITGNRAAVLAVAWVAFAVGVSLLSSAVGAANDARIPAQLSAAIACGYVYQGPPFRLSYKGLGEPLCFTAFGPLATTAFFLALLPRAPYAAAAALTGAGQLLPAVPSGVWALSAAVGVTTTVILFCSHFHQIAGDVAAGKRSPLVQMGTERATQVLRVAVAIPYLITLGAVASGCLPLPLLLATLPSLPLARKLTLFAADNHMVPERIRPLKIIATKWHIVFGLCLVMGLAGAAVIKQLPF